MKRRILYGILGVMLLVTLVFSLASCDVINGLIGGGETDKVDLSGLPSLRRPLLMTEQSRASKSWALSPRALPSSMKTTLR